MRILIICLFLAACGSGSSKEDLELNKKLDEMQQQVKESKDRIKKVDDSLQSLRKLDSANRGYKVTIQ